MIVIWILEVILMAMLLTAEPFAHPVIMQIALGLALGGATGNLVDHLFRGGVVDFIDLGFWPVFNLADSAIVVGILLVLIAC
jgi:signal peptidase II